MGLSGSKRGWKPISALGMGALRLPMEPGNTGRIDPREAGKDIAATDGINISGDFTLDG